MLREFEEKAAREESEDAQAFLRGVARELFGAIASAAEAQRRSLPEQLAEEVASTPSREVQGNES